MMNMRPAADNEGEHEDKGRRYGQQSQHHTMGKNTERGPRDVNDVSWVVGKFLFVVSFHFFITNFLGMDDKANCLNQEK
jgi:hypothetical protein